MIGRCGQYHRPLGAFNPAIASSLIDLASAGVQVGGGLAAQRQQGLLAQRQLEVGAGLEQARLQAQYAMSQTQAQSNTALYMFLGLTAAGVLLLGGLALFMRRRR